MKISDALAAVDTYKSLSGVSDAWLSQKIGSKDSIRNWRRRANAGEQGGGVNSKLAANLLRAVAELPSSERSIAEGDARLISKTLFSENVTETIPKLLYPEARKIACAMPFFDMPSFLIGSSDIVYIDLDGFGIDGDILAVRNQDIASDTDIVSLRRKFGTALVSHLHERGDLEMDLNDIMVVGKVLGVARL